MPANSTESYNSQNLVVSHIRLLNDSSLSLSADGNMVAVFMVTDKDNASIDDELSSLSAAETILAVYRLQPGPLRGQCLFSRRFLYNNPVCMEFSPLGDYLAVGMAAARTPMSLFTPVAATPFPLANELDPSDAYGIARPNRQANMVQPYSAPLPPLQLDPITMGTFSIVCIYLFSWSDHSALQQCVSI